jgi:hypothetical protein
MNKKYLFLTILLSIANISFAMDEGNNQDLELVRVLLEKSEEEKEAEKQMIDMLEQIGEKAQEFTGYLPVISSFKAGKTSKEELESALQKMAEIKDYFENKSVEYEDLKKKAAPGSKLLKPIEIYFRGRSSTLSIIDSYLKILTPLGISFLQSESINETLEKIKNPLDNAIQKSAEIIAQARAELAPKKDPEEPKNLDDKLVKGAENFWPKNKMKILLAGGCLVVVVASVGYWVIKKIKKKRAEKQ